MIGAMRVGNNYVINIGKSTPDWKNEFTSDSVFPADLVFDRENWFKDVNYMKYVKEEENVGIGGLNPGHYYMNEKFNIVVVSDADDDETLQTQLDALPHSDKFAKITIK